MSNYAAEVKPSAQKELEALPDDVPFRIVRKVISLGHAPRPTGCKKLKGHKDRWPLRAGDWRVVYVIDDTAKIVSVTRLAHRRKVYE